MPRLQSFEITVETGEQANPETPKYAINGFTLDFDETEGGTGQGETLKAVGNPDSFPHSLVLRGPREGAWDIERLSITYYPLGQEPYTLRFEPVTLDAQSDLDIWQERPCPTVDV